MKTSELLNGKVKVHCEFSRLVPISELRKHPKNSNRHPEEQIRLLVKIIETNGWRYAVKNSNLSGFVTSGHGRIQAAELMGLTHVPVDDQDYESEAHEIADLEADNNIQELSFRDLNQVKQNIISIDSGAIDLEIVGKPAKEIEYIVAGWRDNFDEVKKINAMDSEAPAIIKVKCSQGQEEKVRQLIRQALEGNGFAELQIE